MSKWAPVWNIILPCELRKCMYLLSDAGDIKLSFCQINIEVNGKACNEKKKMIKTICKIPAAQEIWVYFSFVAGNLTTSYYSNKVEWPMLEYLIQCIFENLLRIFSFYFNIKCKCFECPSWINTIQYKWLLLMFSFMCSII